MNQFVPRITAVGSYTPERRLTNADLERMVETDDEWIVQRTGIRERRISAKFRGPYGCVLEKGRPISMQVRISV